MATGQRAFPGATPAAVFDAVLNRAPLAAATTLNPELPAELVDVITRALEKERERALRDGRGAGFRPAPHPPPARGRLVLERARLRRSALPPLLAAPARTRAGARACSPWRRPALRGVRGGSAPPPLTERDFVLLADFANNTGDPVFDLTLRRGARGPAQPVAVPRDRARRPRARDAAHDEAPAPTSG